MLELGAGAGQLRHLPLVLLLAAARCWCPQAGAACPGAQDGVPSVYLVQNSGWMEPFYTDPRSPFRQLIATLIEATAGRGEAAVADFNQNGQMPGRSSPHVYYCGKADPAQITRAVDAIDLPRMAGGRLTDADFDGALVRAINTILAGQSGIVWIVTNNKNSPSNSQQIADNTRAFAARLSNTAALPAIVAYPIRMRVQGRQYTENGLIIYGIAYGAPAAARLAELVHGAALGQLFPDPAVRLKPLARAPLIFTPVSTPSKDMTVGVAPDGTLVFDGVPGGRPSVLRVDGTLTSEYYPQVIDQARVQVAWQDLHAQDAAPLDTLHGGVEPGELHRLAPRDVLQDVHLHIDVPAIPRAAGLAGLLQKDRIVTGALAISLSDMRLVLPDQFRDKMAQIAALDQLPAVFFDYKTVSAAATIVPVRMVVRYSAAPLIAGLGGLAACLTALAAVVLLLRREREQVAVLAGQSRRVRLRAFETRPMSLPDGRRFRVRGSLTGTARVTEIDRGGKA